MGEGSRVRFAGLLTRSAHSVQYTRRVVERTAAGRLGPAAVDDRQQQLVVPERKIGRQGGVQELGAETWARDERAERVPAVPAAARANASHRPVAGWKPFAVVMIVPHSLHCKRVSTTCAKLWPCP